MSNKKKDPGGVGLQIEAPSPTHEKSHEIMNFNLPGTLTLDEKKYLLAVERGDMANVRRILQKNVRRSNINSNCVDSLGRGALTLAIDNENLEMVELLIIMNVSTKDALLQAINAEFVEAVELLLEHEELIHKDGELYSWQKVEMNTAMFTLDVTPLMLAAHKNNYEIIKILLDRGATLPTPHDIKCSCEDCIRRTSEDSLRHSLGRVNEYRALASPSLIALSSNDPLQTAFQLSWELRNLAFSEQECKAEYLELRRQCQRFAVDLLDQTRSSKELAIILNYDPESPPYQDGDPMKLKRLEMAIDFKQKKFVAHSNIQQLLAALWYEGVPGFRRKTAIQKFSIIAKTALLFPLHCMLYMVAPNCESSKKMKFPFVKFLIHASSYLFFLLILILVSQRAEIQVILLFGTDSMKRAMHEQLLKQRGNSPTYLELLVVLYTIGFIWEETQEIINEGIRSYLRNMWNFIDFSRNTLYCFVVLLRSIAYVQQHNQISADPATAFVPREQWDDFDPQLVADGLFAAANIFSALKLVHLFSINPHLGPLQISLGRMVIDIVKFFFIYSLVLFAFACGLNQLLWYYADLERARCYSLPGEMPDWDNQEESCMKWRRFGNLFESSQSLFWASFGMVGLETFELLGIKSYTRFWGLLMFGSYCVINVIVLLNLLIAMMSNSYAMIEAMSDTEWKFARTKLWLSYFDSSATLPPPFNFLPNVKHFFRMCRKKKVRNIKKESTIRRKQEKDRENRYMNVMRSLVWRFVSAKHREEQSRTVTEDDVNEVKGEISTMRYEILEVLEKNGMDVSCAERKEKTVLAKRMKIWERRLMKDFQVAPVDMDAEAEEDEEEQVVDDTPLSRFRRIARIVASQSAAVKWGQVVRSVTIEANSQIGRCKRQEGFKNQQNLQKAMQQARKLAMKSPSRDRADSCSPIEYDDPANSSLVQLLKKISEEINELSPQNTLHVKHNTDRGHSPLQTLNAQLQAAINKSPAPSSFRDGNEKEMKPFGTHTFLGKASPKRCRSPSSKTSSSMTPQTPRSGSPEVNCDQEVHKSISPPPDKPVPKSSSPTMKMVQSPPPIICVTRTESQLESPNTKAKIQEKVTLKSRSDNSQDDPRRQSADFSPASSCPTTPNRLKRRAPSPNHSEIMAVSRPVGSKPIERAGMLPPPPSKEDHILVPKTQSPDDEIDVVIQTGIVKKKPLSPGGKPLINLESPPKSPSPKASPKRASPENPIKLPLIAPATSKTPPAIKAEKLPRPTTPFMKPLYTLDDAATSSSTEKLITTRNPASDANKAATSPATLRPTMKIIDVSTIKRQPKTGWL